MTLKRTAEEFNDCTSSIIGCAMRVHSTLGNGFQEVIYHHKFKANSAAFGLNINSKNSLIQ